MHSHAVTPSNEALKKLTATDIYIMSVAVNMAPGLLLHGFCHECARIDA